MRIAYLDCFAGISGDMFLGALIDAGVDPQVLRDAAAAMGLGASLKIERVDRSGISSTKVHVLEAGKLADACTHSHPQEQRVPEPHSHQPETQHLHKTGHPHPHPTTKTRMSKVRTTHMAAPLLSSAGLSTSRSSLHQ